MITLSEVSENRDSVCLDPGKLWKADTKVPTGWKAALRDPKYSSYWRAAMCKEIDQLMETGTLVETNARESKLKKVKPMRLKWIYSVKDQENPVRFKALLVILGNMQNKRTIGETYTPLVKFKNINLILTLGLTYKLEFNTIEIEGGVLNAKLKTPLYAEPIPGVGFMANKIFRVERCMCGLKEGPRLFAILLGECLEDFGLKRNPFDPCIWYKPDKPKNEKVFIAVYADILLVIGPKGYAERLVKRFAGHTHKLKANLSELGTFLGRDYIWDKRQNTIKISMKNYILRMNEKYNPRRKFSTMPYKTSVNLPDKFSEVEDDKWRPEFCLREFVGKCNFLQASRVDIKYATNRLSRCVNCYDKEHIEEAKRLMQYLYRTRSRGLVLRGISDSKLKLKAICNASRGVGEEERRFTLGGIVYLGGNLISTECRVDKCVPRSTEESELRAITMIVEESRYFKNMLRNMEIKVEKRIIVSADNDEALLTINQKGNENYFPKNLGVTIAYLKSMKIKELIEYSKVQSNENESCVLTRRVPKKYLFYLVDKLTGMVKSKEMEEPYYLLGVKVHTQFQ